MDRVELVQFIENCYMRRSRDCRNRRCIRYCKTKYVVVAGRELCNMVFDCEQRDYSLDETIVRVLQEYGSDSNQQVRFTGADR